MDPMDAPRRATLIRLLAAVAAVVVVVAGVAIWRSSDDSPAAAPATTTTATTQPATTVTTAPVATEIATAKGASLTVYAEKPADAGGGEPSTPTTIPSGSLAAIPRVGLNSAGVAKVADGYRFANPTYFGNPLVLEVVANEGDWLKVMVAARPNHTEGWVKASDVEISGTTYRMELSLADFHLTVYDGDDVVVETDVVIGKDATHTPVGHFFLNEKIEQSNAGGAYGPWILSTNGYSESLDTFDGGLPVIAFHGTNQPGLIGTKASNGCIRMPNDVAVQLAEMLPAGTPIDIVAGPAEATAPA